MAKDLSQKYRLVARTTAEIYYHMAETIARFAARDDIRFRGRKLGREATLNAVAMQWLAKPEEEKLASLREWVPKFEEHLDGRAPGFGGEMKGGPKAAEGLSPAKRPAGFEVAADAPVVPLVRRPSTGTKKRTQSGS
jgi:hypothetical protein